MSPLWRTVVIAVTAVVVVLSVAGTGARSVPAGTTALILEPGVIATTPVAVVDPITAWSSGRNAALWSLLAARTELDASAGQVLDESTRAALATAITGAERRLGSATTGYDATVREAPVRTAMALASPRTDLPGDTTAQRIAVLTAPPTLPDVAGMLAAPLADVRASVQAEADARAAARTTRTPARTTPAATGPADGSAAPPAASESPSARISRLMAANGLVVDFRIGACGNGASACYLPTTGYITVTPGALGRSDCWMRHMLAHEWRHWWQDQHGWWSDTRWATSAEAEADAIAFARNYGCSG